MAVITYKKGSTARLSENFRVNEFACHGRGCCTSVLIDEKLVDILQQVRDHFGASVTVTSGYRCPVHNKSVGGATGSHHSKGKAADITVKGHAPAEVAKYLESISVKRIGLYETKKDGFFVHVGSDDTKHFWYGQAQQPRSTFGGAPAATPAPEVYTLAQFVRDVQKACGAAVDGLPGPETLSKTVTISAKVNTRHPAVLAVQKRLAALGYTEVGNPDGVAGPKFTSALAHYQQDNGCTVDGEATARKKTWRKLLGMQ